MGKTAVVKMSLQLTNTGHATYSYAAGVRNAQIYGRGYFKPQWMEDEGTVKVPKVAKGKEAKGKAAKAKVKPEKDVETHLSTQLRLRAVHAAAEQAAMRAEKLNNYSCMFTTGRP